MTERPAHLARGQPAARGDLLLERRLRLAEKHLSAAAGGVLLDFGCGNGAQTLTLAPRFRFTVGLDVERQHFDELARDARGRLEGIHPVLYGGGLLPFTDSIFDAVVSFEVLEHVQDDLATARELHRVLRPGGPLVVTVPNRWWIFETHGANLPLLRWNRVPLFSWLPRQLHDRWARARNYRPHDIRRILRTAGFCIESTSYITAPMDVVPSPALQRLLRRTIFAADHTRVPFLATAVLVAARRPPEK